MLARVVEVDHMVTETEKEALILEDALIKEHHPRYNVQLRDDKRYPYLRLSVEEEFPRLSVVRRTHKDGALYFGPFPSATSVRETLKAIQQIFPLRRCRAHQFSHRSRPCLNFQLKRCLAPCCQRVNREHYRRIVEQVRLFLEGKSDLLVQALRTYMDAEARALHFESAARIRDRLAALTRIVEHQKIVSDDRIDRDIVAIENHGTRLGIQLLYTRGGLLLGGTFHSISDPGLPFHEVLSSFLRRYYREGTFFPQEIITSLPLDDADIVQELLSERAGKKVRIRRPGCNTRQSALLAMALENARQKLRGRLDAEAVLEDLKRRFGLRRVPSRIEGFDISNLGGGSAVGSMVVFVDGEPSTDDYRRYRIKSVQGADDYAMTYEVLWRRFHKKEVKTPFPDLIVIDGGKGQLNVAREVLRECAIDSVECVSLAKKRAPEDQERVFLPRKKEPITLRDTLPSSLLLQRIRDEAHRFAITYHKRLRSKAELTSILDDVPGIGPRKKKVLFTHFGDLARMSRASQEDLARLPGISRALAERVWKHLRAHSHIVQP